MTEPQHFQFTPDYEPAGSNMGDRHAHHYSQTPLSDAISTSKGQTNLYEKLATLLKVASPEAYNAYVDFCDHLKKGLHSEGSAVDELNSIHQTAERGLLISNTTEEPRVVSQFLEELRQVFDQLRSNFNPSSTTSISTAINNASEPQHIQEGDGKTINRKKSFNVMPFIDKVLALSNGFFGGFGAVGIASYTATAVLPQILTGPSSVLLHGMEKLFSNPLLSLGVGAGTACVSIASQMSGKYRTQKGIGNFISRSGEGVAIGAGLFGALVMKLPHEVLFNSAKPILLGCVCLGIGASWLRSLTNSLAKKNKKFEI